MNFYSDINFLVKEVTKEKIKNSLKENYCDGILFQCISFFKILDMFIDKDYDLMRSLEINKKEMQRKIEPHHLIYLTELTKKEMEDYDLIREDLMEERRFLIELFKEKLELYEKKFKNIQ